MSTFKCLQEQALNLQFKFPIGAKIARSLTDSPLLVVGREENVFGAKRLYWTIDTDGVRDWEHADVVEAEFIEIDS